MGHFKKNQLGQSAVEFVLIAPFVFFIFFGIIQLVYTSYVALTVQHAAFVLAHESSLTGERSGPDLDAKLAYALLPLVFLNKITLASIENCTYTCRMSDGFTKITASINYPMPIWVPGMGKILGEPLALPSNLNSTPMGQAIQTAAQSTGRTAPNASFDNNDLPWFRWIQFQASTHNEGCLY